MKYGTQIILSEAQNRLYCKFKKAIVCLHLGPKLLLPGQWPYGKRKTISRKKVLFIDIIISFQLILYSQLGFQFL